MLGVIEGNAPDITGWDIADAFPEGGGNWGGSYLVVPANGENVEAAQQFADWLTSPETQAKAFANAGTFPSQIEALGERRAAPSCDNDYFNDAPTGQILIDRADAITVATYKGPQFFQYPRRSPERRDPRLRRSRRPGDQLEHLGHRGFGLLSRT